MRTTPTTAGQVFASPVNPDLIYLFTGVDRDGAIAAAAPGAPLRVYTFLLFQQGRVWADRLTAAEWYARNAVPVPEGLPAELALVLARQAHPLLVAAQRRQHVSA